MMGLTGSMWGSFTNYLNQTMNYRLVLQYYFVLCITGRAEEDNLVLNQTLNTQGIIIQSLRQKIRELKISLARWGFRYYLF